MALKATPLLVLLFATFVLSTTVHRQPSDDDYYDNYYDDYYGDMEDAREDALEAALLGSRIARAHGIIGTITFALLFPLGGILLRLLPRRIAVPLHAAWQILALCLAITTLGMGVWLAQGTEYINTNHAVIGLVASASACLQPVTGSVQHRLFKKRGTRTALSYVHVWWGVAAITLGAINGGLGLQLGGAPRRYSIVYGVFAAVIWLVWMGVSVVSQCLGGFKRREAGAGAREGDERELKQSADMTETEPQDRPRRRL